MLSVNLRLEDIQIKKHSKRQFDRANSGKVYKKLKCKHCLMASSHQTNIVIEQRAEYNDNLELYLNQIGKIFDIPRIINEPQRESQIINYYLRSKRTYQLLHSWEGFMHCGISYDGKDKKEDLKEHARIVERYIHDIDAENVLELAYGLGANMGFLARRNPHVMFDGIDLSLKPLKRYTKMPNVHFQLGDYHDLSALEDNAYDIVFVIEALCYSTHKLQVLREVKKKLKREGIFIIIDGYQRDRAAQLSPSEKVMKKLVEKGFSVDRFECIKDVEGYMREEYSIVEVNDFTQHILPTAISHERKGSYYFAHPMFARAVNKFLPFDAVKTLIELHLAPISIRRQIACYYVHVLKNDK